MEGCIDRNWILFHLSQWQWCAEQERVLQNQTAESNNLTQFSDTWDPSAVHWEHGWFQPIPCPKNVQYVWKFTGLYGKHHQVWGQMEPPWAKHIFWNVLVFVTTRFLLSHPRGLTMRCNFAYLFRILKNIFSWDIIFMSINCSLFSSMGCGLFYAIPRCCQQLGTVIGAAEYLWCPFPFPPWRASWQRNHGTVGWWKAATWLAGKRPFS